MPEYPGVLELAAHLHRLDGSHAEAVAAYERLLALSPDDAALVAYKRARVLIQAARVEEARAALERARELAPHHAMVQALDGLICAYEGRMEQGWRVLDDLLRQHPSFDGVRPLLAWYAAALGRTEAAGLLGEGVREAARADPDAAFWLGAALVQLGEREQGLASLREAVRLGLQDRYHFGSSPLLAPLRGSPELEELIASMPALNAGAARSG
jgi:tetratricopeptide (TPR) repeat protein